MDKIREKWGINLKFEFDDSSKVKDINEVLIEAFKVFIKSEISST